MGWGQWAIGGCNCPGGTSYYTCSPCAIPEENLTVSWTNAALGNGSDTLVYNTAGPIWKTGCSGDGAQLIFELLCSGGNIEFRAYYFTSGTCPTGASSYCSNLGGKLTLSSYTCGTGFTLVFSVNSSCSVLYENGYSGLTVTL